MNKSDLKRTISEYLTGMIMDGSLKPDATPDLISFIEEAIDNREQHLINGLAELAQTWEASMGEDDKSLYTLGLRRAIDLIRESDYKPINGDDVRDFQRPFDHRG
jgi:hypothetical protein